MNKNQTLKHSAWAGAATLAVAVSLLTLPAPAPAGFPGGVSGQRCYPAKRIKGFEVPPQAAFVIDQFQASNSTIGKPFMVCVPANVVGPTPINSTASLLGATVCYKVKDDKGTPKFPAGGAAVVVNGTVPLIGIELLEIKSSKVVCLPASSGF